MLMNEVASAADTLELWKMINDSVWTSLQRMQKQEAERKAAQKKAAGKRAPPTRGVRSPQAAPHKPLQRVPPAPPQCQQPTQQSTKQPTQQPQAAQSTAATVDSGDNAQRLGFQQPKLPVPKTART
jgi:hypothetical protein